jgi:phosphoribosylaminoimidazolecarboxamide formyltransferase/IMP cyclohydrolase
MSKKMYRTKISDEALPAKLTITFGNTSLHFHKTTWEGNDGAAIGLRYGSNPHQAAAFYVPEHPEKAFFGAMRLRKGGKGGLSATNLEDGYRALRIVNHFEQRAIAVMKHLNPTGVGIARGTGEAPAAVFEKAWSGDPRAAYGSVVGLNFPLTATVAQKMIEQTEENRLKHYVECLFAPQCTSEAVEILQTKRNLRIVETPEATTLFDRSLPYEIKVLGDGILLEQSFYTKFRSLDDLAVLDRTENMGVVTRRYPTPQERQSGLYALWVCGEKRSNGVVIWGGRNDDNDRALAVGTGQQDRIGSIEIALNRANRVGHDLRQSVLASDGFMLEDNIEPLANAGVSFIIQPGGSRCDKNVIQQCNEQDMAMILTGERWFRHF